MESVLNANASDNACEYFKKSTKPTMSISNDRENGFAVRLFRDIRSMKSRKHSINPAGGENIA